MASAVFEGTSLVNMFVRGCWVNGIRRLIVSRRGDEEEFFEIRTEWSDRSVLYLHRSLADLGRLWQRLRDAFPEDRPELARAPLRQGLVAIKDAHDIETRLNEVEKLLKTVIGMPRKYSRSEVVLTFFERSPLDQVLKNDNVHKIQPSFQSPVKISEIMRSNGFCLANTETIVIDHGIPSGKDQPWPWTPRSTCLRMVPSLPPSWRTAMTQQLMSPTCPTTTWCPSRRTSWTESPWAPPPPAVAAAVHRAGDLVQPASPAVEPPRRLGSAPLGRPPTPDAWRSHKCLQDAQARAGHPLPRLLLVGPLPALDKCPGHFM
uniref:PX domain containing 1 n=1 Tax=Sus scrofa TaxID=9823 RepID=A0A5G2QRL0_PIG